MTDKNLYETNDRWTKKDTMIAIGLFVTIAGLISITFFIGNALGIPEFQIH